MFKESLALKSSTIIEFHGSGHLFTMFLDLSLELPATKIVQALIFYHSLHQF
jgi:hypothetical protein